MSIIDILLLIQTLYCYLLYTFLPQYISSVSKWRLLGDIHLSVQIVLWTFLQPINSVHSVVMYCSYVVCTILLGRPVDLSTHWTVTAISLHVSTFVRVCHEQAPYIVLAVICDSNKPYRRFYTKYLKKTAIIIYHPSPFFATLLTALHNEILQ